jgi:hypothetical protein
MLEKLLLEHVKNNEIVIPYEYLIKVKVDIKGVTIPIETFIELKVKQIVDEIMEGNKDE